MASTWTPSKNFWGTTVGRLVERVGMLAVSAVIADVVANVNPATSAKVGGVYAVLRVIQDWLNSNIPNWPI